MVQAHWSINTYIARLSLIIYYHSLFYSLRHGATIMMSYCDIRYHSSTWVTFLSNNSTIWHHISTRHHNCSTMTTFNIGKYWLVNISILSQYGPLLKVMWPGIDQSALSIYIRHNNIQMWTCDEDNMEFYGSEATILTEAIVIVVKDP